MRFVDTVERGSVAQNTKPQTRWVREIPTPGRAKILHRAILRRWIRNWRGSLGRYRCLCASSPAIPTMLNVTATEKGQSSSTYSPGGRVGKSSQPSQRRRLLTVNCGSVPSVIIRWLGQHSGGFLRSNGRLVLVCFLAFPPSAGCWDALLVRRGSPSPAAHPLDFAFHDGSPTGANARHGIQ
jgi:hypothetical protein